MSEQKQYPSMFANMANDYDPQKHMISLKGRDYLNVQNRLVWFIREQRQMIMSGLATCSYVIRTEEVKNDTQQGYAEFRTYIRDVLGNEATMYGSETARDFPDYAEKASTKSVGRALLLLGYGTSNAIELDEIQDNLENPRVVDSPVEHKDRASTSTRSATDTLNNLSQATNTPGVAMFACGRSSVGTGRANASVSRPSASQATNTPAPTPGEAMVTDRQKASIQKLCAALSRPEPDFSALTFVGAKEMLTTLARDYSASHQANDSAPTSTDTRPKVKPAVHSTTERGGLNTTLRGQARPANDIDNWDEAIARAEQEYDSGATADPAIQPNSALDTDDDFPFATNDAAPAPVSNDRKELMALAAEFGLAMDSVDWWKDNTFRKYSDRQAINVLSKQNMDTALVWVYSRGFKKAEAEEYCKSLGLSLDGLWGRIYGDSALVEREMIAKFGKKAKH